MTKSNLPRRLGCVLAATEHGTMILNRFDYHATGLRRCGVGSEPLDHAAYYADEVGDAEALLGIRRLHFGDGVVAVDCGANIGVHTLEWARSMTGWGAVIAIEAQERIFYALAGRSRVNFRC
jgi:hypothetical protein